MCRFKRVTTEFGYTVESANTEYRALTQPLIQRSFSVQLKPLTQAASQGLALKVMQEQSVPYTQESGRGILDKTATLLEQQIRQHTSAPMAIMPMETQRQTQTSR